MEFISLDIACMELDDGGFRYILKGGLGQFGDAVSATPIRRHPFGDAVLVTL